VLSVVGVHPETGAGMVQHSIDFERAVWIKSRKGYIPRPLGRSMLLMIPRCLRRGSLLNEKI